MTNSKRPKKHHYPENELLVEGFDELTGTLEDIYNDTSGRYVADDLDDYEYQQEQAHGVKSKNLQPIPTDRYIKRTRKS